MKRAALAQAAILLVVTTQQVQADPGHQKPQITVMRWQEPPVTANEPGCEEQGTCAEEILVVRAHDPDSSITEIQVWFDENGDRAPIVFAHTYCVQGREPGQPARLEIGSAFSEPGTYTVAAVAYSHRRCLGHEDGDRHPALHSRVHRVESGGRAGRVGPRGRAHCAPLGRSEGGLRLARCTILRHSGEQHVRRRKSAAFSSLPSGRIRRTSGRPQPGLAHTGPSWDPAGSGTPLTPEERSRSSSVPSRPPGL